MQHPEHLIGNTRASMTPQRMVGLALVGLIHVAVIYALIMGLAPKITRIFGGPIDLVPIKDHVLPPPKPSDPVFIKPHVNDGITPVVVIDDGEQTHTITTTSQSRDNSQTGIVPDTGVRGIARTHTIPDYPELARRLDQQGTVQLRLSIASDGTVIDAVVENSSGSEVLDQAAIDWVKMHWRYQPATHQGTPVAGSTEAAIRFDLRTAR